MMLKQSTCRIIFSVAGGRTLSSRIFPLQKAGHFNETRQLLARVCEVGGLVIIHKMI
jgi:hypothetical protein